MNIMITGGAGYIGSILSRILMEKGYKVTILDRLYFGTGPLEDVVDRITLIKDDVRDFGPSVLNGIDTVPDLASLSNDPRGELDPQKTLETNYKGRVRERALCGVVICSFLPEPFLQLFIVFLTSNEARGTKR